ncbi:Fe(3+) dicitrate ABC transporter ATP-binding protein FecE [Erwinia sp. S43]|uniref:Fe(3+) dicitrate ABC transporter ATP-binding protein FecE n=1 Tax=unclassified Erwinia TaxID=2622719 RepID=UPI00190B6EDA|nr:MULTISPECIES: Fe(3+) dicitrate ABC transporter ATP-binding protein FecE [unclassified Erwinia]MBK0032405.1 Fe(3+) dicitrate ABC transporter ATP-binding protein FecE [Erwinia sp. S43]MCW1873672.1 Fe(3+) dicitrate ABC transporter ATP-binding protein FecE [Erwinia sp. INIA01]
MPLSVDGLSAGYTSAPILQNLSLTLPAGKITALLGPNGCGKSTLLRCCSRLLKPRQGRVMLGDDDLSGLNARKLGQRLALLPQQHSVPEGISVRELVGYGRSPWLNLFGRPGPADRQRVQAAIDEVQIGNFAEKQLSTLSGGQRQRAFLAMTLAQDTPLLLLDEPTTWLDINHQVELLLLLRRQQQQGKTVVTVLHDLNQASRYCDHLVLMMAGQVVASGTPEQVMTPELLHRVFSINAEIHADPVCGRPMCVVL